MAVRGEIGQFFCDICGRPIEREDMVGKCVVCGKIACRKCGGVCSKCGRTLCMHHVQIKKGVWYCSECKPRCFIVTAVGTTSKTLELFYWFRDSFLKVTSIGRYFIRFYYRVGPHLAQTISNNKFLKALSLWFFVRPIGLIIEKIKD